MFNSPIFRSTWIKKVLASGGLAAMLLGLALGCGGRDAGTGTPVGKSHSLAGVAALRSQAPHTYALAGTTVDGAKVTGTITLGREPNQTVNQNVYEVSGCVVEVAAAGFRDDRRILTPAGNPHLAFCRESGEALVPVHGYRPLPAAADSNERGTLGTLLGPDGSTELSWALAAGEEPGTATVTLSSRFVGKDGVTDPRETVEERYLINADGSIRAAAWVADLHLDGADPGKTLLRFDPARP